MINRQIPGLRKVHLWLCLWATLGLWSCDKTVDPIEDKEYPEYIIIGKYTTGVWCAGETCVEKYKISTNGIFEDTNDQQPQAGQFANGTFEIELTQSDYEQIIALLNKHTYDELFQFNNSTLGTMWADNFHFYFEYKSASKHQVWLIDGSFDGSVPPVLQPFLIDLNQMVQIAQF